MQGRRFMRRGIRRASRRPGFPNRGGLAAGGSRPSSPFTATPLVVQSRTQQSSSNAGNANDNIDDPNTSATGSANNSDVTMERLFEEFRALSNKVERICGRLQSLEDKVVTKELSETTKKHYRNIFSIRGSPYEV